MSLLELLRARRSIRSYSPRPVPRDKLLRCLEAARLAPSACNSQPWYFIIVDDEELRGRLCSQCFSGIYSMSSFAKGAPVIVAVVRNITSYAAALGGFLRGVQFGLIDIGIAGEHFVLQAQEEGLGTCWLGWFNERAAKRVLGLGRGAKVDVLISVGYPQIAAELKSDD